MVFKPVSGTAAGIRARKFSALSQPAKLRELFQNSVLAERLLSRSDRRASICRPRAAPSPSRIRSAPRRKRASNQARSAAAGLPVPFAQAEWRSRRPVLAASRSSRAAISGIRPGSKRSQARRADEVPDERRDPGPIAGEPARCEQLPPRLECARRSDDAESAAASAGVARSGSARRERQLAAEPAAASGRSWRRRPTPEPQRVGPHRLRLAVTRWRAPPLPSPPARARR